MSKKIEHPGNPPKKPEWNDGRAISKTKDGIYQQIYANIPIPKYDKAPVMALIESLEKYKDLIDADLDYTFDYGYYDEIEGVELEISGRQRLNPMQQAEWNTYEKEYVKWEKQKRAYYKSQQRQKNKESKQKREEEALEIAKKAYPDLFKDNE